MKDWTQELSDFLRFSALERRLAPMTCSAYERDVSACLAHLHGQGIGELAEVRVTHLRAFLADEQGTRPAVSSQARATAALKCFFRFLMEEERLERDPALPLRTPKKREVLPDVLSMGVKDPGKVGGSDAGFCPGGRRCSCDGQAEEVSR